VSKPRPLLARDEIRHDLAIAQQTLATAINEIDIEKMRDRITQARGDIAKALRRLG
jgi:hypothetical protein